MLYFSLVLISLSLLNTSGSLHRLPVGEDYSQRGITRFEKNDFDGAVSDFTKAIELNGSNLEFCYYFRGMANYRQGNLEVAIADISKAITIRSHPRFYEDRGTLLLKKATLMVLSQISTRPSSSHRNSPKLMATEGLVHLMRGENAQAELDFKKCFELDSTLQTQISAAASQIKQRAASSQVRDQPSDVKVVKFDWSEMPERILNATPSSIGVSSTGVSQTGTRVLANPGDKGDPGRPEVGLEPSLNPSTARSPRSPARLEETFTLVIQNVGDKTIVGVRWTYFFYPKDVTHEPTRVYF